MPQKKMFINEMGISEIITLLKSDELPVESSAFSLFLAMAIQKKDDELFNLILQKSLEGKARINFDQPIQNGLNFLSLAIMYNHFNYFQKLLLLGASATAPVGRNIAKMNQKLRSVSALCDSLHMSALSIAVDLGRIEMLEQLKKTVSKKELIAQALRIGNSKEKEGVQQVLLSDCKDEIKALLVKNVKENNFKEVSDLLHLKVLQHLDFVDENRKSVLINAVVHKAYDAFIVLKEAREDGLVSFDENFVSENTTPLNEAILSNQTNFVKKLLFMGANPIQDLGLIWSEDKERRLKKTPLYTLTEKLLENKEAFYPILFYVSCVLSEVTLASEAVKIAKFLNTQKVYKILLKNSSNLSNIPVYSERLIKAVQEGDADLVSFLIERCVSPVEMVNGTNAVYEATKLSKLNILKLFTKELSVKKLETKVRNVSPFESALWYQKEEAAVLLAQAGVQLPTLCITGKSVLMTAVESDMASLVKELITRNPKLKTSKEIQEAFWYAVSLKKNKVVKLFCDLKIDTGHKNIYGTDLLILAVKK